MQQQTPKQKLLKDKNSQIQLNQFPTFPKSEEEIQIPEIFTLGGNKLLNYSLLRLRQQKLKHSQNNSIITVQNLGKVYELQGDENVVALKEITLQGDNPTGSIKRGEFVIIRGPSGGGKTTFLNLLGTIDKSSNGNIWIDGQLIVQDNKDAQLSKLRRDKIGIVFQTFNLLALMTAFENIELPMRIKGQLSQKQMKQRTRMLLKRVGLSQRADHLPSQLSGGEQQRVAIARSLSNSPSIILLDEPTGDLDSKSTVQVMNLLLQINNFGYNHKTNNQYFNCPLQPITIIMVTHNEDLQCYGDRIIFFQDGKIKKQVFNQYQFALDPEEYSSFLNTKA